jgi:predicted RNA binding protein YcfA (HicA-like mRNA interferase family)
MNAHKILSRVQRSPSGVRFAELATLLEALGFHLDRIKGSHHIFKHAGITEIVNIQDVHGQAKPYQVRQVLTLIEKYDLRIGVTKP